MKKLAKMESAFNGIMALFLALMGLLIFTNVALRYLFNSGLTWAEELSRFLFVWTVFLGAIGALKDNNHLGFTSLVQKLPPFGKKICFIISNAMVLGTLWVLFQGSLKLTMMTSHTLSPATGIPLSYMYIIGIISSVGMFLVVCCNIYRAIFVKGAVERLVVLKESEEEVTMENSGKGEITQ
ncbi:TRAP transporter small permease [Anaerospora sp.]|uniref:TRAP transporter small permease n=1 Tax=Anaerospora sp. TaxID=1960278 RepID=UPI0028A0C7D0|nr:TRAP transporter small permease [Anaerospora sp.]MDF2930360.1 C4-dicarboxylate transporter permease [Anaerospora sp.]